MTETRETCTVFAEIISPYEFLFKVFPNLMCLQSGDLETGYILKNICLSNLIALE